MRRALPLLLFAVQVSAEIISASRRVDWTLTGLPGGIPDTSAWTVQNVTTYGAVGDGVTDCTAAIQSCLNAASTSNKIYFPTGVYLTTNTLTTSHKSLEFVGDGASLSKIKNLSTVGAADIIQVGASSSFDIDSMPLTAGYTKDSTLVTASNATGFAAGDYVLIDQLNDTNGTYTGYAVTIDGSSATATWVSRNSGTRGLGQMALVTGVSGNDITITPPLSSTLYSQLSPQICRQRANSTTKWVGFRDLYLENAGTPGGTNTLHHVELNYVANMWVTNCEFAKCGNGFLYIRHTLFGEITHNWLHHDIEDIQNRGYGIELAEQTTRILVQDNIIGPDVRSPFHAEWGANANVFGYNYCSLYKTNSASPGTCVPDYSGNHGAHPRMNLFEGNVGNAFRSDFLFGSSSHYTVFRNNFYGASLGSTNGVACVDAERSQTFYNVVGNILGNTGFTYTYESVWPSVASFFTQYVRTLGYYSTGLTTNNGATDSATTLIWHGNYDHANNAVVWDGAISDHDIPNSMYLVSKPNWWGNLTWPPIGPDVYGMVNPIPAQIRSGEYSTPPFIRVVSP